MKLSALPFRNLARKQGRTWALILLTAFLSLSMFGGSMIVLSLRSGLNSLEARLGADIIVVPKAAKTKINLETMLLQGTSGAFYMDAVMLDNVCAVNGVERAAPQTFLASLKADCCSAKVQVIGIDQDADFTIQPWIAQSTKREMGLMDVVAGCDISANVGESIRLYNLNCPVVAKLSRTGTGLDTAIYCGLDTMQALLSAAEEMGVSHKVTTGNAENVISAVYVKVLDGESIDQVTNQLNSHPSWNVTAVQTKSMLTDVSDGLAGISATVTLLIVVVWVLAFIILLIAFTMIMNERRREFAVLRLIGSSRKMLSRIILAESALVSLAGGMLGICIGALLVFPFTSAIEAALKLPFLTPSFSAVLMLGCCALLGTVIMGALASVSSAYRMSKVDTGSVLREGN